MRTFTYKKQGNGTDSWVMEEDGVKSIIYVTPGNYITKELSKAFDAKFETYWSAKGYSDLDDLNSHAANPDSPHHAEALSLLQWAHTAWENAVVDVNENSNVQAIIQSLPTFEPAP